jgi:threonine synthase
MHYLDSATGDVYPLTTARWCADNGNTLELAAAPRLRRADIQAQVYSVWRYAKALLVDNRDAVSMGEGWTPLMNGEWDGACVLFKCEFMMPTGSFKDRGMTVMVSYLKRCGISHVLEDSSGNAGASLSAYAAAALGMSSKIFYASHNWQPFFIEGTKTLAYELWEQLGFTVPDNIVVPLGYGSNVLGCDRGFAELKRNGEIDRVPRIFGVQAANCAPYHAAFKAGVEHLVPIEITSTVAEGIASSKPTRVIEVLRAVRGSGGEIVAVSEAQIVAALGALARKGCYVEPTSAAAAAGLTQLLASGAISPGETTVLVLTGSGLKASEKIGGLLKLGARLG